MSDNTCPICKKQLDDRHHHAIELVSRNDEPLAFVFDVQGWYDNSHGVARSLAIARRELSKFFPGKEFDIQPHRMMVRNERATSVVLGEAFVASYVAFER